MNIFSRISIFYLPFLLMVAWFPMQVSAASCKYLGDNTTPVKQYEACPDSQVAAYQAALYQFQQGKRTEAQAIYNHQGGDNAGDPLNRLSFLFSSTDPYQLIADLAQQQLKEWRNSFKPLLFTQLPPEKPQRPALPKLIKKEFETTAQFKVRVNKTKQQREQQIIQIEE